MKRKKATHFRIIGLQPFMPDLGHFPIKRKVPKSDNPIVPESKSYDRDADVESLGRYYQRIQSVHKALCDDFGWKMFYKGFEVAQDFSHIVVTPDAKRDFSIYDTNDLKISISAIVGRNGSGKSSIVELFVRAINNLSAAMLGEGFNFASAEHLHFIEDVYVNILFQIESKLYILFVDGRNIGLRTFSYARKNVYEAHQADTLLCRYTGEDSKTEILRGHRDWRKILSKFFYTLVCNYSLYSFNYRDFEVEATPAERLKKLKINVPDSVVSEDSLWLKGIFHKNDGYQTPIVLHPMRHNGQLDIKKENELAKERLLSMLFYEDAHGEFPMRIINGNLEVTGIKFKPTTNRKFAKENIIDTLGISHSQNVSKNFNRIYDDIYQFWDNCYSLDKAADRPYFTDARDYIVYKTLKIILNYKKYYTIFRYLSLAQYDRVMLHVRLKQLLSDNTHITRKLRCTLYYLVAPHFDAEEGQADLYEFEEANLNHPELKNEPPYMFLPPPIFDTEIIMEKELHTKQQMVQILFNPDHSAVRREVNVGGVHELTLSCLSSGERQIAYTISNILYHLVNVDSEWDDQYHGTGELAIVQYKYMNIILDEVELYFHPEMQRQFLALLLGAIQSVKFRHLRGINIMFATHSPFILSDIPDSNILKLGHHDNQSRNNTFAGNIMEMLSDSFYMDSSIGEVARQEISNIAAFDKQLESVEPQYYSNAIEIYSQLKPRFHYVASIIGDSFLRSITTRTIKRIEQRIAKMKNV